MKRAMMVLALILTPVAVHGQQSDDAARKAALEARRDSLEVEIVQKFVRRLSHDVGLNAAQRSEVERVLKESGERRRELSRASSRLRGSIYRAARSSETADEEFVRLLQEHEALRTREHDVWRREQAELERVLTPRQRARFLLAWAHFQDDMRDILSRRMREQSGERDRRPEERLHEDDRRGHHDGLRSSDWPGEPWMTRST